MKYSFQMLDNEFWWGGAVANHRCPLNNHSEYHEDFVGFTTSASNQVMPFFVSSLGRYIWSDHPFKVDVRNGEFVIEGEDVELTQEGNCLREAYLAAMRTHFPCDQKGLPEEFFKTAQYNTWMEFTYYPTQEAVLEFARDYIKHGRASLRQ